MFVEAHYEAVTWDLRRYCGARLRDLYTGDLLWVELDAYLQKLPMESATWTEQRDAMTADQLAELAESADETKFGPWSKTDFLIADVYDAIERLRYIQTAKSVKDSKSVALPEPRKRPGVGGRAKPKLNLAAVSYLEEIRERHRREAL